MKEPKVLFENKMVRVTESEERRIQITLTCPKKGMDFYPTGKGGYTIWYDSETANLGIDPSVNPAVDVTKFDSGGITIEPRAEGLSTFPYIRLGDEELWDID